MEISIKGNPEEIAALVLAVQERRDLEAGNSVELGFGKTVNLQPPQEAEPIGEFDRFASAVRDIVANSLKEENGAAIQKLHSRWASQPADSASKQRICNA